MTSLLSKVSTVIQMGSFAFAANFDSAHETHEFVKCKIESLVANTVTDRPKEGTLTLFGVSLCTMSCKILISKIFVA